MQWNSTVKYPEKLWWLRIGITETFCRLLVDWNFLKNLWYLWVEITEMFCRLLVDQNFQRTYGVCEKKLLKYSVKVIKCYTMK